MHILVDKRSPWSQMSIVWSQGFFQLIVQGGGGKFASVCKACGKLGESRSMLPWEILILLDVRNLVESDHTCRSTRYLLIWLQSDHWCFCTNISYHLLCYWSFFKGLNWFTRKIEFSAYPRGGKCPPPPPERNPVHNPLLPVTWWASYTSLS